MVDFLASHVSFLEGNSFFPLKYTKNSGDVLPKRNVYVGETFSTLWQQETIQDLYGKKWTPEKHQRNKGKVMITIQCAKVGHIIILDQFSEISSSLKCISSTIVLWLALSTP